MVKVNYDFYNCNYGGTTIPREVFDSFAKRATSLLDNMLRTGKENCEPEKIKQVLCEICDELYREDRHRGIEEESLDGYQIHYDNVTADGEILRLVRRCFGDEGLLYRGR